MPNKRDEAADDSPEDLPCLEKLDSPIGKEFYYSSYCFQARSGTFSKWIITMVTVLIICGCVCPVWCQEAHPLPHYPVWWSWKNVFPTWASHMRLWWTESSASNPGALPQTGKKKNASPQLKWPWLFTKLTESLQLFFQCFSLFSFIAWRAE